MVDAPRTAPLIVTPKHLEHSIPAQAMAFRAPEAVMTDLTLDDPKPLQEGDDLFDDELQFAQQTLVDSSDDASRTEPLFVFQGNPKEDPREQTQSLVKKHGFSVQVPPAQRRWEYQVYEEPAVVRILEEYDDEDPSYLVRFEDGSEEQVSSSHPLEGELSSFRACLLNQSDLCLIIIFSSLLRLFIHFIHPGRSTH